MDSDDYDTEHPPHMDYWDPNDVYIENGRGYHVWQKGLYWLPLDEAEREREDMLHGLFYNGDKLNMPLHCCPISPAPGEPARVLDLGCGTGFWAIEMSKKLDQDKMPHEIIATDLIAMQPAPGKRNITYRAKCNFNDRFWPFGEDSFDLIHLSMVTACTVDWPELYRKVYKHLRPGLGHIEHLDLNLRPYCFDDVSTKGSVLHQWYEDLVSASARAHRPIEYDPQQTHRDLLAAGFVDIKHTIRPIPWHYYETDERPEDRFQVGGTWQIAMVQSHQNGMEAYSMAPFTRTQGWSKEDVERYAHAAERDRMARRLRLYCHVHYWTGRKPA